MKIIITCLLLISTVNLVWGQVNQDTSVIDKGVLDSLYIQETESVKGPDKVLHAEPLYIDLIRDLGARKGEKEWNVAMGITDRDTYDSYIALVEYEFAPINRLGFEVELPFSFYSALANNPSRPEIPQSKLNSIKLATQYSFYVNEGISTSMAVGYIHEFELTSFENYGKERIYKGNIFNPFFIAAKRWGDNIHTLLYTGPVIEKLNRQAKTNSHWQINTSFHYMIRGTRNFIGIEFNKEAGDKKFDMTIRPQMRLGISDNLLVGIVTGIPVSRESERFSSFIRLIYEPGHRHRPTHFYSAKNRV